MEIKIVDDHRGKGMLPNGTYAKSKGGTEMMADRIQSVVEEMGIADDVNIIHSRVRDIASDKKNFYVIHDTWLDPECEHLKIKENRERFEKIIFVSNHQMHTFNLGLGVPYSESIVMKNAINPISLPPCGKPTDKINLIYHTTPHRGLELLVPAFEHLAEKYKNIHLDVYSSFKIYGWDHRDQKYEGLFDRIKNHPQMTYHGYQPNDVVRDALKRAHIFAYPNIWPETSCIAALEAMSAKCEVVCPNFEALPETTAGFAIEYPMTEDPNDHVSVFVAHLEHSIKNIDSEHTKSKLEVAKFVIDSQYSWENRKDEWKAFLSHFV